VKLSEWKKDLSKSNRAFLSLVWPVIQRKCGGGEIKPVEVLADNDLALDLDRNCGIDIWQSVDGVGARGIASRVQFTEKNWQTFTVRKSRASGARTEYAKRLSAIESGGRFIYPYLTSQAFVDATQLVGVGVARTVDIFDAIKRGKAYINQTDNADFFCVRWADVFECWEGLK
jgi:hypothetical protein